MIGGGAGELHRPVAAALARRGSGALKVQPSASLPKGLVLFPTTSTCCCWGHGADATLPERLRHAATIHRRVLCVHIVRAPEAADAAAVRACVQQAILERPTRLIGYAMHADAESAAVAMMQLHTVSCRETLAAVRQACAARRPAPRPEAIAEAVGGADAVQILADQGTLAAVVAAIPPLA